jgi:hypothetical protein
MNRAARNFLLFSDVFPDPAALASTTLGRTARRRWLRIAITLDGPGQAPLSDEERETVARVAREMCARP